MNPSFAIENLDGEPTASLLERRWFAAKSAILSLQSECDLLLEAFKLAESAWQRARQQLADFEALSDALENQLTAFEAPAATPAVRDALRPLMSLV